MITICSDKGAPGVTTTAVALSVVWQTDRVLMEADPSGGDLALRLRTPQGANLRLDRSVTSVAADARAGLPAGGLARYAQPTSVGFPVLLGPMSAEGFEPMARLWPQVASAAHTWAGTVIADLGRLQLRHASSPVAATSTAVVLLTHAGTSEDLFHVRQRAHELAARLGQGPYGRSPLVVAVVAAPRVARGRVSQVQQALAAQATTSTIPVAGFVARDERAVDTLRAGVLTKRVLGSDLVTSAKELMQTLTGWFPELIGLPARPMMPTGPRYAQSYGPGQIGQEPSIPVEMNPGEQLQGQLRWGPATSPVLGGGSQ